MSNQTDFEDVVVPRKSIDEVQPSEWDAIASELWVKPQDPNVTSVVQSYLDRAEAGMVKYGVTTSDNPLSLIEWLVHLQQELMDATIYIERTIEELEKKQ